jgi:hypothetical protein
MAVAWSMDTFMSNDVGQRQYRTLRLARYEDQQFKTSTRNARLGRR